MRSEQTEADWYADTIITALPERWHTGLEDTLFDAIRQSGINSFKQPEDLISHIVFECVTFLDKFRDAGLRAHILDIYENCIARRVRFQFCLYLFCPLPNVKLILNFVPLYSQFPAKIQLNL
jgi:hypothetical protein